MSEVRIIREWEINNNYIILVYTQRYLSSTLSQHEILLKKTFQSQFN